ncbi:MAG: hypothetical protein ACLQVJ_21780, partial [Syntrophobacteraceae bacterium]
MKQLPAQAQRKSTLLANVENPDVTGVHNENDLNMLTRFRSERALFRPGAVGPPARIATACGGGRPKISTLREAVHRYASAQPLDFLAPFGAALGNPEMAGHQTVRASTKNASFPTQKLQVSYKVKFSYV